MYGEDFQDFMHHGATQRSSIHSYIDLFCYQAPASRSASLVCMLRISLCMLCCMWAKQLSQLYGHICIAPLKGRDLLPSTFPTGSEARNLCEASHRGKYHLGAASLQID